MSRKKPNWAVAACGLVYLLAFLFLPVYRATGVPLRGTNLLSAAPATILLLLCGLGMVLCALLVDERVSLFTGFGCALVALIFCFLGKTLLADVTGVRALDKLAGLFVTTSWGLAVCVVAGVAHGVLEIVMGNQKVKKITPNIDDFGSFNNGPIDF